MIASTQLQFSGCKVNSFATSNNVWNITMVDKEFCEFTGGCFENITCIKDKSIFRISTYYSEDKMLSIPQRK